MHKERGRERTPPAFKTGDHCKRIAGGHGKPAEQLKHGCNTYLIAP